VYPNNLKESYRFMFEKLTDRADIFDERLDELGDLILKEVSKNKPASLAAAPTTAGEDNASGPPAVPESLQLAHLGMRAQEDVLVVGRVCVDSESRSRDRLDEQSERLTVTSATLEGSRDSSGGARTHLVLQQDLLAGGYALFPGQIVGALGTNPTGTAFVPSVFYDVRFFPPGFDVVVVSCEQVLMHIFFLILAFLSLSLSLLLLLSLNTLHFLFGLRRCPRV
jgi:DNA polymerase alpha subunit B